jgi:hypothetical protein
MFECHGREDRNPAEVMSVANVKCLGLGAASAIVIPILLS